MRYKSHLWALTANHVLAKFAILASQVLIPYEAGSHENMPIAEAARFATTSEHPDCTDVVLFEIDEKRLTPGLLRPETIYNLDLEADISFSETAFVSIHGFPTEINFRDEEQKALMIQRCTLPGKLNGPASVAHCFNVRLLSNGNLKSHDGFSGAPVFLASAEFDGQTPSKLLGINIRGNSEKLTKKYLSVRVIKHMMDQYLKGTSGAYGDLTHN